MSWLGREWTHRAAIGFDNTAGPAGDYDLRFTIPTRMSEFWRLVLSTGFDVRVTAADGVTVIPDLKRESWTYADQAGVFAVNAVPLIVGVNQLFVYWGNPDAGDVATSPTIATPIVGVVALSRPVARWSMRYGAEKAGATLPATTFRKFVDEQVRVWWDFSAALERAASPINGSDREEEIKAVVLVDCEDNQEASVPSMLDQAETYVHGGWVSTWVKLGTDGVTYTLRCRVKTTTNRQIEARALLEVANLEQ